MRNWFHCGNNNPDEGFLGYPPTGNKVKYDVVDMFRLRDGKLCEHWDVADTRAPFTQVGAIPASTTEA